MANSDKVRNSDIFANMSSLARMKVLYNPADFPLADYDYERLETRVAADRLDIADQGVPLSDAMTAMLAAMDMRTAVFTGSETGRWRGVDPASGRDRTVQTTYARVNTLQSGAQAPTYPVTRPARAISFINEENEIGQESRKESRKESNQETSSQEGTGRTSAEEVATNAEGSQESGDGCTGRSRYPCADNCYAGPARRPVADSQARGEADTGPGSHPAGLV